MCRNSIPGQDIMQYYSMFIYSALDGQLKKCMGKLLRSNEPSCFKDGKKFRSRKKLNDLGFI